MPCELRDMAVFLFGWKVYQTKTIFLKMRKVMCYSAPSPGSQSMKLKRVILGLCTTLLIVLSGCAGSDERSVQEYLEDRYNEQFTILDSEASADGGSAFSHNFTAFCVSESHPDCVFKTTIKGAGSGYGTFEDEYANGILSQRINKMAKEKLGDAFGEHFLACYLYQNNSLVLSDWDALTYEMYFGGLNPYYCCCYGAAAVFTYYVNHS